MSPSNSDAAEKKLLVIGAGPMGLAAAYYACTLGYEVDVVEASDRPGGMAAHFDFGGLSLERFYHFCCKSDFDTMSLLGELGLHDAIRWVPTKMGCFVDGQLYPFGDPLSLLRFPKLGLIEKLRYGAMAFFATKRRDWRSLDLIGARQWLTGWCGEHAYDMLWRPLFAFKFYEFADSISAAWVWQRIKRLGNSRRSIFQEELGYIDGGSQTLIDHLTAAISRHGGRVHVNAPVRHIWVDNEGVRGLETASGQTFSAPAVISTVPLPYVASMLQRDAGQLAARYQGFDNVAVACVVHKLRKSVSPNFWVNVSDAGMCIPGFVEFSNLRPMTDTIVYVPYYMPATEERFGWSDAALGDESFRFLQRVNPALASSDRIDTYVGRLRYAQPVCTVGFAAKLPPAQTPVKGLQIADTSFYYPEDRGISESIKFARRMVASLTAADLPQASSR